MSEITPNTPNPVREDAYKQQLAAKLGIDPQYIPGSPIWHSEEEIAAIAEMFANMAGGSSGGGVLVVNMVYDEEKGNDYTDKTWKEIYDAPMAVIVEEDPLPDGANVKNINHVVRTYQDSNEYAVFYYVHSKGQDKVLAGEVKLVTDSENGYLTYAE